MKPSTRVNVTRTTICLPTRDLRAAFLFYRDGIGLEVFGVPAGSDEMPEPVQFVLQEERSTLMLIPSGGFDWVTPGNDVAPPGVSECLLVLGVASDAEVDMVIERARSAGAELVHNPELPQQGYTRWFKDLDGHLWMVDRTG